MVHGCFWMNWIVSSSMCKVSNGIAPFNAPGIPTPAPSIGSPIAVDLEKELLDLSD